MKDPQIKLSIKNLRAIEEAKIIIDGISVITGENGCGKSTISKLSYHLFKTSIDFDSIIDEKIDYESEIIYRTIDLISRELTYLLPKEEYIKARNILKKSTNQLGQLTLFGKEYSLTETIDYLSHLFNESSDQKRDQVASVHLKRIKRILEDSLPKDKKSDNIVTLLNELKALAIKNTDQGSALKEDRPLSVLYESVDEAFNHNLISHSFDLEEMGVSILDNKNKKLIPLYSIQHVAYIDTPMMLGIDVANERAHWGDLNSLLYEKGTNKRNKSIDILFEKNIIKGDINIDEYDSSGIQFIYKREDGSEFNLADCATGLKSFAILQILYKNGFLGKKTLLIIDEPEAHLHPQWVVEYARLIVLLNKNLGVKFLIASHHPDMISAIRYIAEKEKTTSTLNFYLAEKNENNYLYTYRSLGLNIDDIFSSFNIALERIDQYGKTE